MANVIPLLLLAGTAAILIARSGKGDEEEDAIEGLPDDKPDDKPDGDADPGNGGNGNGITDPPPRQPITKDGVVVGNWDGDMLVCVDGWRVSMDGTDCIRSFAPTGGQSAQDGDVRWDIYEEGAGWRWRAWRHTVSFSKSGWAETGIADDRAVAWARAGAAAAELKLLDGARVQAVEEELAMAMTLPASPGSPYKAYPPLKQVFTEREVGPNISYGINMYEDGITRQDGRFFAILVIPERDSITLRRSKSSSEIADPDVRIEAMYNLMMMVVSQYW